MVFEFVEFVLDELLEVSVVALFPEIFGDLYSSSVHALALGESLAGFVEIEGVDLPTLTLRVPRLSLHPLLCE